MVRNRILLSQNFLRDSNLVRSLILKSTLNKTDVVIEIGPGEGIITRELARVVGRVIAIEKDSEFTALLRSRLNGLQNVEIHESDFLKYNIKERGYKVFSNIPFNITSDIVRKMLYKDNPPTDAYLVMQEEAAQKFAGIPRETEFSILMKPWFDARLVWKFRRTDFIPVPSVDVVLINITKRDMPLISSDNARIYHKFVKFGFGAWKKSLDKAYKHVFTYEQWKRMSKDLEFTIEVTPTQLTFEQWFGLFRCFMTIVPPSKRMSFLKS
jgi:23S rRNA (adenine-N6)-dimethyltransferase